MRQAAAVLALVATLVAASPALAQFPLGSASPVLTLDQERLFDDTEFGRRVTDQLAAASRALAAENRRLEEMLSNEERELTTRRPDLDPGEFRRLADAFDARAETIRREQEAKTRALGGFLESERVRFFDIAVPILVQLVRESGAVAVLDSRAIFLAADQIDMTDIAIARLDTEIGSGEGTEAARLPEDFPSDEALPPANPPDGGPPLDLGDPAGPMDR